MPSGPRALTRAVTRALHLDRGAISSLLTDLTAFFQLDETAGNRAEVQARHTALDNNTVLFETGLIGNAALFVRTSSEYLSIADDAAFDLTDDFTISLWVRDTHSAAGWQGILAKENWNGNTGYLLRSDVVDGLAWSENSSNPATLETGLPNIILDSEWHQIVITKNSGVSRLYVDGRPWDSATDTLTANSEDVYLGARHLNTGGGSLDHYDGSIDLFGVWSRVLTASELIEMYNERQGLAWPFTGAPTVSSLITGLSYYWPMVEASGVRYDHVGNKDLSDYNTAGVSAGPRSAAATFLAASNERLGRVSDADMRLGDEDYSISLWIKPASGAPSGNLICSDNGSQRGFILSFITSTNTINFQHYAGNTSVVINLTTTNTAPDDVWAHIVVVNDSAGKEVTIYVNNSAESNTYTGTPAEGAGNFDIGDRTPNAYPWSGAIAEVGIWHRQLTSSDVSTLYNSDNGLSLPFVTQDSLYDDLLCHYPLNENTGQAKPAWGPYNLADNNTVQTSTGLVYNNARKYQLSLSEYHSLASNNDFKFGDSDFTIAVWVKMDSLSSISIVTSWEDTASREWRLIYSPSQFRFRFDVNHLGTSGNDVSVLADALGAPSTGVWYLMMVPGWPGSWLTVWPPTFWTTLTCSITAGSAGDRSLPKITVVVKVRGSILGQMGSEAGRYVSWENLILCWVKVVTRLNTKRGPRAPTQIPAAKRERMIMFTRKVSHRLGSLIILVTGAIQIG